MRSFGQVYMEFADRIFRETARVHRGENTFLSPLSAFMIAALLESSTAGDTRRELRSALGEEFCADERGMKDELKKAILSMERKGDVSFINSNAFAVNHKYEPYIDRTHIAKIQETFPDTEFVCRADTDMAEMLNRWTGEKTKGLIDSVMPESTKMDLFLFNVVAFIAEWRDSYSEYAIHENEDFTNSDGEIEKVTMLASGEDYYIHSDGISGFTKPYKGGEYEFLALLPDDPNRKIEDFLEEGIIGKLRDLYQNRQPMAVGVKLPEFTYSDVESLSAPLKKLGITKVFHGDADMSPILVSAKSKAHVADISQKVYVLVNRKGTKAAAVTCCECEMTAAGPMEPMEYREIYLDRPFLFAIMHRETGLPVFAGTINKAAEEKNCR